MYKKLLLVILAGILFSVCSYAQVDEFSGAMTSWANIKTRFGARGDGKTDDSRAFQLALDSLSCSPAKFNTGSSGYTTIYIPAGRYVIKSTLILRGKIGIQIIGEDPGSTILEWKGDAVDTMLWTNGSAYYKISRLTFEGNNTRQLEGLGIHWMNKWKTSDSRSFAALNIEVSDCYFKNLAVGLGGGYKWNDSEIKISRCLFSNCSEAGIRIRGANALDYWIWYCRFLNCNKGVDCYRGNYHLYYSYFEGSRSSDIFNDNGYYNSVRGCFSNKAEKFSYDTSASSNPFVRIFQNNQVYKPTTLPITYLHSGKLFLIGNRFDKNESDTYDKPETTFKLNIPYVKRPNTVAYTTWAKTNLTILSYKNQFEYKEPYWVRGRSIQRYIIEDKNGQKPSMNSDAYLAAMPGLPVRKDRKVFEVAKDITAEGLQEIVNQAAALKGQRPLIHFGYGQYYIGKTVTIPAGADIQMVGDGMRYSTVISADPKGFRGNALFHIKGPSTVQIRDLQLSAPKGKGFTAILAEGIDQQQARLLVDQLYALADTSLAMQGLDYMIVEKNNSFFSDGNIVSGGKELVRGAGTSTLYCFGGSYAGLTVRNNGSFVAKDCWWEGGNPAPVNLKGVGNVTIDGSKMAPTKKDSLPIIKIGEFKGKVSLLNMYIQGGIEVSADNPGLQFLLWNANMYYKKAPLGAISGVRKGKIAFVGLSSQCFDSSDPDCKAISPHPDTFVNVDDKNAFLEEMISQTYHAMPARYSHLPSGVSNMYFARISLDGFATGILLQK